jgi:hypothetical protein
MRFAAAPANAAAVPAASSPRDEKTTSFGSLMWQACATPAPARSRPANRNARHPLPSLAAFFCDHPVPGWSHDDAVPGVGPARRGFPNRDVDPVALCAAVSAAAMAATTVAATAGAATAGAATTGAAPALAATAIAATTTALATAALASTAVTATAVATTTGAATAVAATASAAAPLTARRAIAARRRGMRRGVVRRG